MVERQSYFCHEVFEVFRSALFAGESDEGDLDELRELIIKRSSYSRSLCQSSRINKLASLMLSIEGSSFSNCFLIFILPFLHRK